MCGLVCTREPYGGAVPYFLNHRNPEGSPDLFETE